MLTELHIQNVAVIHKATVSLEAGLNVFTGETGAGKTVLISAIDAVLGERASKDMIRTGEDKAMVTALFEEISPRARDILAQLGYQDEDGTVLISREITAAGKSSCKINGIPATAAILKSIASLLIHIHGQRDSMQLLAEEKHLSLIDTYGELEEDLAAYTKEYHALCDIRDMLASLQMDDAQKAQRMDMLSFQIEEIEGAELLDPNEEETLLAQRKLIRNSEKVQDSLALAYSALQGIGEGEGILTLFDSLTGGVGEAAGYLSALEPMAQRVEEISYELAEYAQELRTTLDEFAFDPQEMDSIEYRLDTIYKLKRKYGASIAEILSFLEAAKTELQSITGSEQRISQLTQQLDKQQKVTAKLAATLTKKRAKAAAAFLKEVEAELAFLDMPSVKLTVQHTEKSMSASGVDQMEFYIVTNVGELPKPLSKIASGGEVSRIMLAIKNVLAEKDDIATLIFDEVDTGVSGRAAQKIGQKLAQVAGSRQVICVTHLAQVAAFGDNHLYICKEVEKDRTFTRIATLSRQQRIEELARINSGDLINQTTLKNAEELLLNAQKIKQAV